MKGYSVTHSHMIFACLGGSKAMDKASYGPFIYADLTPLRRRQGIVICLCGLQLTRKAQATYVAAKCGIPVISTGDHIRSKCREKGTFVDFHAVHSLSSEISGSKGIHVVESLLQDIQDALALSDIVLIDSVKTPGEVRFLKERFEEVIVIAFLASHRFRFDHAFMRCREDDAASKEQFDLRDIREIERGIAQVIVFADYFVLAGGVKESREQVMAVLREIFARFPNLGLYLQPNDVVLE